MKVFKSLGGIIGAVMVLTLGTASAFAFEGPGFGPPGMGGPKLNETQKNCIKEKTETMTENDRHDMSKMRTIFEDCKNSPLNHKNDTNNEKTSNNQLYDFKTFRGQNNDYIRIGGNIPKACSDFFELTITCEGELNQLTFNFIEIKADGLKCLESNKSVCDNGESITCLSLDLLSKTNKNFSSRFESSAHNNSCAKVSIKTAKVFLKSEKFDPSLEKSEAGTRGSCISCAQPTPLENLQSTNRAIQQHIGHQRPSQVKIHLILKP